MNSVKWEDFKKIDFRVGTIVKTEAFPEAQQPAYKIWVDLGDLGVKKSSAQITSLYKLDELIGKQVLCVCNFPPKQVGPIKSEVLITGFTLEGNQIVLASPDRTIPNGTPLA